MSRFIFEYHFAAELATLACDAQSSERVISSWTGEWGRFSSKSANWQASGPGHQA